MPRNCSTGITDFARSAFVSPASEKPTYDDSMIEIREAIGIDRQRQAGDLLAAVSALTAIFGRSRSMRRFGSSIKPVTVIGQCGVRRAVDGREQRLHRLTASAHRLCVEAIHEGDA